MKAVILPGMVFARLHVIAKGRAPNYKQHWVCQCECGRIIEVRQDSLLSKNTMSCGCFGKEKNRKRLLHLVTKHGFSKTRLYKTWKGMRDRCAAHNKRRGKNYADKNITVCDEWQSFLVFREWALNNGYKKDLSIERINVFEGYTPNNCCWVSISAQQKNKTNSIRVCKDGVCLSLVEWSKILKIKYLTLYQRYKKNEDPEYVLRPYRRSAKQTKEAV